MIYTKHNSLYKWKVGVYLSIPPRRIIISCLPLKTFHSGTKTNTCNTHSYKKVKMKHKDSIACLPTKEFTRFVPDN